MLDELKRQISASFADVLADPRFVEDRLWLTLYLFGQPENLRQLGLVLAKDRWFNLEGYDSGFVYAKLEVTKEIGEVLGACVRAMALSSKHQIEIHLVDADTNPEVAESSFVSLYKAPF